MQAEGGVQSIARAFAILEQLTVAGGEAGVAELAVALGLPAPTVHRLLQTLTQRGYVLQLPSRRYSLGPGLIRLGEGATHRLSSWAMPGLRRLGEMTRETVNLAIFDGDMAAYVAQVPSPHQMRMFTEVGRRVLPHASGVGKALLSTLSDDEVREVVNRTGLPRYTSTTLTNEGELLVELNKIRHQGFAVDDGEQEVGVRCFAVPISGLALPLALSISGPAARVSWETSGYMVSALKEVAVLLRSSVPQ